jgi:hypothetical protein
MSVQILQISGPTGSGKSIAIRALVEAHKGPVLAYDPERALVAFAGRHGMVVIVDYMAYSDLRSAVQSAVGAAAGQHLLVTIDSINHVGVDADTNGVPTYGELRRVNYDRFISFLNDMVVSTDTVVRVVISQVVR